MNGESDISAVKYSSDDDDGDKEPDKKKIVSRLSECGSPHYADTFRKGTSQRLDTSNIDDDDDEMSDPHRVPQSGSEDHEGQIDFPAIRPRLTHYNAMLPVTQPMYKTENSQESARMADAGCSLATIFCC